MKTVKQAIIEHVQAFPFYRTTKPEIARQSFKAGIDFSQRWVSIDDELPEENTHVIVKVFPAWRQREYYYAVAVFRGGNFYINKSPNRDVSFWRPIELK
jgi:hypothetical protein